MSIHAPVSPESALLRAIRLALADEPGLVLWRNNAGVAHHVGPHGRHRTRYGLTPGAADLVGILGPRGRFVALEVKSPRGRVRPEQSLFLALVVRLGGVAAVVRSVEEARDTIAEARHD